MPRRIRHLSHSSTTMSADTAHESVQPSTADALAERLRRSQWEGLSEPERDTIEDVLQRIDDNMLVARDPEREFQETRTVGERLSDQIAAFGGSWTFILLFVGFLGIWAVLNTEILGPRHDAFDPYPYIFLNLLLSMVAALQAPVIMMAQNRAAQRDRMEAKLDYEVNLKAEIEIRELHDKLDMLRESQWKELVSLQHAQIAYLTELLRDSRAATLRPTELTRPAHE